MTNIEICSTGETNNIQKTVVKAISYSVLLKCGLTLISVTISDRQCRSGSSKKLLTWPGILSSSVTDDTSCGSPQSPWVIEGAPGQRIDISMVNFGWTASNNNHSTGGACQLFGHIIERSLNINRSLCGGSTRESHLYTSMSNVIEIQVLPSRLRQSKANFLLKYTGKDLGTQVSVCGLVRSVGVTLLMTPCDTSKFLY